MTPIKLAAAAIAAAFLLPATSQAATIAVQGRCFPSGHAVAVLGQGFTPGAAVSIAGDAYGSAAADAAGNFATQITAPYNAEVMPKTMTISATESGAPAPSATTTFPVVREAFVVDANLNGNPRAVVRWRFAGFLPDRPVYGHFRLRGRTIRNYRFGVAQGPCGTLTTRARRLPVRRLLYGNWQMKFDNRRTYSPRTAGRLGSLTVFRRYG